MLSGSSTRRRLELLIREFYQPAEASEEPAAVDLEQAELLRSAV